MYGLLIREPGSQQGMRLFTGSLEDCRSFAANLVDMGEVEEGTLLYIVISRSVYEGYEVVDGKLAKSFRKHPYRMGRGRYRTDAGWGSEWIDPLPSRYKEAPASGAYSRILEAQLQELGVSEEGLEIAERSRLQELVHELIPLSSPTTEQLGEAEGTLRKEMLEASRELAETREARAWAKASRARRKGSNV